MRKTKPLLLTRLTAHVHLPIDSVFTFVANHENYKRWYPGVVSVSAVDDLPHGVVGKTYLETLQMPGGRLQDIQIVTIASAPPHSFVTQGDFAPLLPQMTFELTSAEDGGTNVMWMFHSRHTSHVRRLVARLIFRPILKRQATHAIANLTRLLEHDAI